MKLYRPTDMAALSGVVDASAQDLIDAAEAYLVDHDWVPIAVDEWQHWYENPPGAWWTTTAALREQARREREPVPGEEAT